MLKADPNTESNVTIHQGTEKMPAPYHRLYVEKAGTA